MVVWRSAFCVMLFLVLGGCQEDPVIEGEWAGVTDTQLGPSFYYKLSLDQVSGGVTGKGGISVYTQEGAAADSTFTVDVEGTYTYPDVVLTITGPIPTLRTRGTADFRGMLASDGTKIEGTLSSPVIGTVDLDLERIQRD